MHAKAILLPIAFLVAFTAIAPAALADAVDDYNRAADAYNSRLERHKRAAAAWNNERDAFNREVSSYNATPAEKRTKLWSDRLDRWSAYLLQRLTVINDEFDSIQRRKAELDRWYDALR